MKKIALFAIIALTSSFATAGALDVAHDAIPGVPHVTPCVDGTKKSFYEPRANGLDGMANVVRTCVNGSFFAKANPTIRACKEGNTLLVAEHNGFTDRTKSVVYVCKAGKYVARGF